MRTVDNRIEFLLETIPGGKHKGWCEAMADSPASGPVTNFIASAIQQTTDIVPAIGVSISSDKNNNTLDRVIFSDNLQSINATKLKILYWRY